MRDPSKIGGLLGKAAEGMGVRNPVAVARVFSAWKKIVGPEIAARCEPTGLKDGVLKVSIESPAWAGQFKYLAPEVMRRLNEHLGAEIITEIKPWVITANKAGKKRAEAPKDSPPPPEIPPLPTPTSSDLAEAERQVASIPDERLAESMKRALLAGKMHKRRG